MSDPAVFAGYTAFPQRKETDAYAEQKEVDVMPFMIVSAVVAVLVAILAVQNSMMVDLTLFMWSFQLNLVLVVLLSVICGLLLGIVWGLTVKTRSMWQTRKLNEQIASELSNREKSQEEREKTFNQTLKQYDDKNVNIEQIAANLNGMRPEAAVNILVAMDDQTVIDVLRKVEEIAARNGTSSMGSYWLSLMPAERAAEIQRKMLSKPDSLK